MFPSLAMLLAATLQTTGGAGSPDDDPSLRLQASAWLVVPSGWLSITRGSRPGTATTMSVGDELALDLSVEPLIEVDLALNARHALGARFWTLSLSGTGVDEEPFIYHGFTFDAGRPVRSDVDFFMVDAGYTYTFNPGEPLQLSGTLGIQYWSFKSRLRTVDDLPRIDTWRGFDSAFWMAGIEGSWRATEGIHVSGFLAGGTERREQYFVEAQADARVRLWGPASLSLGYRFESIHFRQSTNRSGLNFHGPIFGMEIRF